MPESDDGGEWLEDLLADLANDGLVTVDDGGDARVASLGSSDR